MLDKVFGIAALSGVWFVLFRWTGSFDLGSPYPTLFLGWRAVVAAILLIFGIVWLALLCWAIDWFQAWLTEAIPHEEPDTSILLESFPPTANNSQALIDAYEEGATRSNCNG